MTGPVPTEALADQIEAKMKAMSLLGGDALRAATHDLGSLAYIHSTQIVRALRSEAAHQQVTAERDEDRAEHARYRASAEEMWETAKRHGGRMLAEKRRADVAEASLASANAELARLRAEGEGLDG